MQRVWILAALFAAGSATAQQATTSLAEHENWSVFVANAEGSVPKQCFIATKAEETTVTLDGAPSTARREEPILHVTNTAGVTGPDVVSVDLGYPPDSGKELDIRVGGASFTLVAGTGGDAEWAWTTPDDDAQVVEAMRGGAAAVVTTRSTTGKTISDTFSLIGFTAALEDARARCVG